MPRTIKLRTSISKKITRPIQKLAIPEWEIIDDDTQPTIQLLRIEDIAIPELTEQENIKHYLSMKKEIWIFPAPQYQTFTKKFAFLCILEITEDAAVDLVNFKDNRGRFKANKSRRREKITPTFLQDFLKFWQKIITIY